MTTETQRESKTKFLSAALHAIRAKGYAATTVDGICNEAGLTKGSFFHHFKSKDELALSAAAHRETMTESFFAAAPYRQSRDPLDRLFGYVDFRAVSGGAFQPASQRETERQKAMNRDTPNTTQRSQAPEVRTLLMGVAL